ncbi:MAG: hypothetical protein ACJAXT_001891, partial [Paracoccaceae bacterium]
SRQDQTRHERSKSGTDHEVPLKNNTTDPWQDGGG